MPLFDVKEFGEAAPFLRKTDLELLAVQTVAFDGIVKLLVVTSCFFKLQLPHSIVHNLFCRPKNMYFRGL